MKVGLVDVDGHGGFPSLALMKISAWHKANGDSVEWYDPMFSNVDKVYASKIFTFTDDYHYFPDGIEVERGGTGYDIGKKLPDEIDKMFPDYSIYPAADYSIGFLSRGCIRNCPWCVVPKKEGYIARYSSLDKIARGGVKNVLLMDNNFLANDFDFVREQLELSSRLRLRIDFNQALDCRLVTDDIAIELDKASWIRNQIRFSCDTDGVFNALKGCIATIKKHAHKVYDFFIYVLVKDFENGYERVRRIMELDSRVIPFVMPYKNLQLSYAEYKHNYDNPTIEERKIRALAKWANNHMVCKSTSLEEFNQYKKILKGDCNGQG